MNALFQVYNISQNVQEDDLQHLQVTLSSFNANYSKAKRESPDLKPVVSQTCMLVFGSMSWLIAEINIQLIVKQPQLNPDFYVYSNSKLICAHRIS